jgi:hypothetical protein
MTVHAEPAPGRNAIIIDDAQRAKAHEARIVIFAKRKRVTAIKPTKVGTAPISGLSDLQHDECSVRSAAANIADRLRVCILARERSAAIWAAASARLRTRKQRA